MYMGLTVLKKKQTHYTSLRRLGERRYSSSFLTSAVDGGEWSASRPGSALAMGEGHLIPIVQEAGWAPEAVWILRLEERSFRLCRGSNPDRQVVQPIVTQYTDDIGQTEMYTAGALRLNLGLLTLIAVENLKKLKVPGVDKILSELIRSGVTHRVLGSTNAIIRSGKK
jgi:hypothetical protein